jgi:hypothetical protein
MSQSFKRKLVRAIYAILIIISVVCIVLAANPISEFFVFLFLWSFGLITGYIIRLVDWSLVKQTAEEGEVIKPRPHFLPFVGGNKPAKITQVLSKEVHPETGSIVSGNLLSEYEEKKWKEILNDFRDDN